MPREEYNRGQDWEQLLTTLGRRLKEVEQMDRASDQLHRYVAILDELDSIDQTRVNPTKLHTLTGDALFGCGFATEASKEYKMAMDALPRPSFFGKGPDPKTVQGLHSRIARSYVWLGRYDDAKDHVQQACDAGSAGAADYLAPPAHGFTRAAEAITRKDYSTCTYLANRKLLFLGVPRTNLVALRLIPVTDLNPASKYESFFRYSINYFRYTSGRQTLSMAEYLESRGSVLVLEQLLIGVIGELDTKTSFNHYRKAQALLANLIKSATSGQVSDAEITALLYYYQGKLSEKYLRHPYYRSVKNPSEYQIDAEIESWYVKSEYMYSGPGRTMANTYRQYRTTDPEKIKEYQRAREQRRRSYDDSDSTRPPRGSSGTGWRGHTGDPGGAGADQSSRSNWQQRQDYRQSRGNQDSRQQEPQPRRGRERAQDAWTPPRVAVNRPQQPDFPDTERGKKDRKKWEVQATAFNEVYSLLEQHNCVIYTTRESKITYDDGTYEIIRIPDRKVTINASEETAALSQGSDFVEAALVRIAQGLLEIEGQQIDIRSILANPDSCPPNIRKRVYRRLSRLCHTDVGARWASYDIYFREKLSKRLNNAFANSQKKPE